MAEALVLRRIVRSDPVEWAGGDSFLGGAPRIDPGEWPRTPKGVAMHFLGQISLADLPPLGPARPASGYLSFFANTEFDASAIDEDFPSAVLFRETLAAEPAAPPADLMPVYGESYSFYVPGHGDRAATPRLFPRWPVRILNADAAPPVPSAKVPKTAPVARAGAGAIADLKGFLESLPKQGEEQVGRLERLLAKHLETRPKTGLAARLTRRLGHANASEIIAFDQKTKDITAKRDAAERWLETVQSAARSFRPDLEAFAARLPAEPFAPLPDGWAEDLADLIARLKRIDRVYPLTRLSRIAERVAVDLATAPEAEFAALPEPWRSAYARETSTCWDGEHQMFGAGLDVQGAPEEHADDVMLLQLTSDKMLHWMWGDVGVLQFWIAPDDLRAARFERTVMTIEGH